MKRFALLLLTLFLASCTDPYELNFTLVLPEDTTFLDDLNRVTISHGSSVKEYHVENGDLSFDAKFSVGVGEVDRFSVRGYDASGDLIAAGHSPLFTAVDAIDVLSIYFAPVNTVGTLHDTFPAAIAQNQAVTLRGNMYDGANDVSGHIFLGGTVDATLSSQVYYYDPWFHETTSLNSLQEPALGIAVMQVTSSILLLYGGQLQSGELSDALWYYPTSCASCGGYQLYFPENSPPPMSHATVVQLGPFTALYNELDQSKLLNAFLIMGGTTDDGIDPEIHLVKVFLDSTSSVISIYVESVEWPGARDRFAAVVANPRDESTLLVGVHGGDGPSQVIEVGVHSFSDGIDFTFDFNTVTTDATVYAPMGLVANEENLYFFSGTPVDGTPLDTVTRLDMETFTMETLSAGLITPHASGAVERAGYVVLIAGGENGDGLSSEAEVLTLSESGNALTFETSVALSHPRLSPNVLLLPTGDLAICGGVDASGTPVQPFDIFTPNPLDSGEPQTLEE